MNYRIESIKTIGDLKPGQRFMINGMFYTKTNHAIIDINKEKVVFLNPSTKIDCLVKE